MRGDQSQAWGIRPIGAVRGVVLAALAAGFCSLTVAALLQRPQEELDLYYKKWIEEDVVYIVTPEERSVFEALQTPDEKDQFIEQFWRRRDPTPATQENEFKLEHYRRIAYVNERYFSGVPGWKTDRGRIYIRFGEPDSIEKQPYGGPYKRRNSEGGGETTVFPFERWWYAHIEGVGSDIEVEFVDRDFTNEYRLSINPNDKDAFLYTPGHGNTQAEFDGLQSRFERIRAPMGIDLSNPYLHRNDLPFVKLRRWSELQKAPAVVQKRLEEFVTASIRFEQLPFEFKADWLRLGDEALVPLTISLRHQDLQFGEDGRSAQAQVNLFGRVIALNGVLAAVFEDDIVTVKTQDGPAKALYQRMLVLEPGRYRIDLAVEDVSSGRRGVLQTGMVIPRLPEDELAASPVILVERVEPLNLSGESDAPDMFALGTLKILPRLGNAAPAGKRLLFYFQLYNFAVDEASQLPDLHLSYQLLENGQVKAEKTDEGGGRAAYLSPQRIAFLEYLDLRKTKGSPLLLRIQAVDRITGQSLTIEQPVRIEQPSAD